MILQRNMETKFIYLFIITFFFFSCDNTDYQVLKIDNQNKKVEVLDSNYVIDSIAFEKDNKNIFSISLKNKFEGSNTIDLSKVSSEYKLYINHIDSIGCNNVSGIIFIRKKGFRENISKEVIRQKKHYQEIQQFFLTLKPCSNSIEEIKALRRLK